MGAKNLKDVQTEEGEDDFRTALHFYPLYTQQERSGILQIKFPILFSPVKNICHYCC